MEVYGEGNFGDTQQVELSLDPVGALIDGSEGEKIVRQLQGQSIGQTKDIPLAATASRPVTYRLVKSLIYASSVTSSFKPAYLGATGSYKLTLEARLP